MRVCVFCGSSTEVDPRHLEVGRAFGRLLAARGIGLVYGGASMGLMRALADAALAGGGEVIGVIPRSLVDREIAHPGLTSLEVVGSMHARKARMAELADAFAVLPGGYGTLDEAFEAVTWRLLGIHHKPIGFLDADGFWQPLQALVDHLARERFVRPAHRSLVRLYPTPGALLDALSGPA